MFVDRDVQRTPIPAMGLGRGCLFFFLVILSSSNLNAVISYCIRNEDHMEHKATATGELLDTAPPENETELRQGDRCGRRPGASCGEVALVRWMAKCVWVSSGSL